jgi:hypothetical protein
VGSLLRTVRRPTKNVAEFEESLETARQTALYVEETDHNMYYGYEDLAACEIAFFKNQPAAETS